MKNIEKAKAQKVINKIQAGIFDENDVDNLFMRLRAYSNGFPIFREIADFVAHNHSRDRGITHQSLKTMYLKMKFLDEYRHSKRVLDLSKPFPIWIKTLFQYQVNEVKIKELKEKFNVTPEQLNTRIKKGFKDDKKTGNTILGGKKLSQNILNAIKYAMSNLYVREAFNQDKLIKELLLVLAQNNLEYQENLIIDRADKIVLCILLLFHSSEFDYKGYKAAYCTIKSEKMSILCCRKYTIDNANIYKPFGNLEVHGNIILEKNGKDFTISYLIFSTNLSSDKWCSPESFISEPLGPEMPNYFYKKLRLDGDLSLNEKFQLHCMRN